MSSLVFIVVSGNSLKQAGEELFRIIVRLDLSEVVSSPSIPGQFRLHNVDNQGFRFDIGCNIAIGIPISTIRQLGKG